jgi:hypothetical protein
VADLNALIGRRVAYYEYPWAIERHALTAKSLVRALFQPSDVNFIFAKSMPRSGHRFLATSLKHYFADELRYCEYYPEGCCGTIPCTAPYNETRTNRLFLQKSHDFGFRDSSVLKGKYLIQYRSPIPRLQSNFDLYARDTGRNDAASFRAFAEEETTYFINFYRKWIATPPRGAFVLSYEDLTEDHARSLAAVIGFIEDGAEIDQAAFDLAVALMPVGAKRPSAPEGALRDPATHPYFDREFFRELEQRVAQSCGTDRTRFHFLD